MLRMAFATVAGIDGVELVVKLHPRAPGEQVVQTLQAEFPNMATRVVRGGPLRPLLEEVGQPDGLLAPGQRGIPVSAGVGEFDVEFGDPEPEYRRSEVVGDRAGLVHEPLHRVRVSREPLECREALRTLAVELLPVTTGKFRVRMAS